MPFPWLSFKPLRRNDVRRALEEKKQTGPKKETTKRRRAKEAVDFLH